MATLLTGNITTATSIADGEDVFLAPTATVNTSGTAFTFDPDVSGMDEVFQLDRLGIELRTKSLRQLLDFRHQMLQIAMHAPGFAGALGLLTRGQVLGMC